MKDAMIHAGFTMQAVLAISGVIQVSRKPEEDLPDKELMIPKIHEVRPPTMTAVTAIPERSGRMGVSITGVTE